MFPPHQEAGRWYKADSQKYTSTQKEAAGRAQAVHVPPQQEEGHWHKSDSNKDLGAYQEDKNPIYFTTAKNSNPPNSARGGISMKEAV